jgi:SdrD B-like domain
MSKQTRRLVIVIAIVGYAIAAPRPSVEAQSAAAPRISGTALTPLRQALSGHLVRLRALNNGRVVKTVTTAVNGEYAFDAIDAGTYWIEVADPAGRIISTDGPVVIATRQAAVTRSPLRRTFAADSIGTLRAKQLLANANPAPAAAVMEAAADAGIRTRSVDLSTRPLPSAPR